MYVISLKVKISALLTFCPFPFSIQQIKTVYGEQKLFLSGVLVMEDFTSF